LTKKDVNQYKKGLCLKIVYFNAKGAYSKKESIQKVIDYINPDIVAITETWFKSWIPKYDNYVWYHKIREKSIGSGVSFLIKKCI